MQDLLNSEIRQLALNLGQEHRAEAVELACLGVVVCGHLQQTSDITGMNLGPLITLQSNLIRSWAAAKGLRWADVIDAYDALNRAGHTAAVLSNMSRPLGNGLTTGLR